MTTHELVNYLAEHDLWVNVYPMMDGRVICVDVKEGDWKHEHLRTDFLMKELGYTKLYEEEYGDDLYQDDCYSSIHKYIEPR